MYHDYIPKDNQVTERTRIYTKSIKGEITQKVLKGKLSLLYATHHHDLFYITVKYHQNIPKGFQVIERTWKCLRTDVRTDGRTPGSSLYPPNLFCTKSIKGETTQKVLKGKLSFLYATHHHDLFYITVKYHQNIPNGFQVIERTWKCLRTDVRTDGRTDGRTLGSSLYPPKLSVGG